MRKTIQMYANNINIRISSDPHNCLSLSLSLSLSIYIYIYIYILYRKNMEKSIIHKTFFKLLLKQLFFVISYDNQVLFSHITILLWTFLWILFSEFFICLLFNDMSLFIMLNCCNNIFMQAFCLFIFFVFYQEGLHLGLQSKKFFNGNMSCFIFHFSNN